jgi:hypothetical protein
MPFPCHAVPLSVYKWGILDLNNFIQSQLVCWSYYLHLGYMLRHKCRHQAFINLKHKLSYIKYNAASTEDDKDSNY